ncbi:MAG: envelope stress response membrane protein PspB [Rhodospirillales bacterium]|jgi:phage shock protein B|nr:envelope stress response membrane protein PspB [Rhodospirillales bacterium]
MEFLGLLNVPLIVFLSVVLPIWIVFHYVTKWKQMKQAGAGEGQTVVDRKELKRLRESAVSLEERIDSLETILDGEAPEWRNK